MSEWGDINAILVYFALLIGVGESYEPVVREASEAVRDRRGVASEAGPD